MWMLYIAAGACFGSVLGFLACAWLSANKTPECINCQGLIDRDSALDAANKDIKALCDEINRLNRSRNAIRRDHKKAVEETQRIAFFHQKEA